MATSGLSIIDPPKKRRSRLRRVTRESFRGMTAIEQMRQAFRSENWLSAALGLFMGGLVPIAVYALVHNEVIYHPWYWLMAMGGLAYSAISVYHWAESAFHMRIKAVGFVLLLEGTVTFSKETWLGLTGLAFLVLINGVSAAVALQAKK